MITALLLPYRPEAMSHARLAALSITAVGHDPEVIDTAIIRTA